jgi:diguanylate cyclase (GGDEF)-like protein/PAS domain S-box-containing protein
MNKHRIEENWPTGTVIGNYSFASPGNIIGMDQTLIDALGYHYKEDLPSYLVEAMTSLTPSTAQVHSITLNDDPNLNIPLKILIIPYENIYRGIVFDPTPTKDLFERAKKASVFNKLLNEMIDRFIQMGYDQNSLADTLLYTLGRVGALLHLDQCLIVDLHAKYNIYLYQWSAEKDESTQDTSVNYEEFDWLLPKMRNNEEVHCPDISALAETAQTEYRFFLSRQIGSFTALPIFINGIFFAFGIMGKREKGYQTNPKDVKYVKLLIDVFSCEYGRKIHEYERETIQSRFNSLFECSLDGLYRSTPEGRYISVNPALVRMLGYESKEELLSIHIPTQLYVSEEDRPTSDKRNSLHVLQLKKKNGDIIWVETTSWINTDKRGDKENIYYDGIVRDITRRRRVQILIESERQRFYTTLQSIGDGVITTDASGNITLLNPVAEELTGWSAAEAQGKPFEDVFHIVDEHTCQVCENPVKKVIETGKAVGLGNHTILISRNGIRRNIADSASVINSNGKLFGVVVVFRDVTEQVKYQSEIEYLSMHDELTGLYNRRFFSEQMKRLNTPRQYPLTIIMGDLNGLKLVNDTFGHSEGDLLIQQAALALKKSCREEDVIARWGGDEFIILLPQTSEDTALQICKRIRNKLAEYSGKTMQISMSLGCATKTDKSKSIEEILREAEERMYRSKLNESKSTRSAIITSLKESLQEKSSETSEHAERLGKLALKIADALKLSDNEKTDLKLLATLHDIGKISISDRIINKKSPLTEEEWNIIKKHPEAGYRIAISCQELMPIARNILCHHEHWDGSGYPMGLSGTDIPLHSRILAVVDAYDTMVTGRPYKEALSHQEAVKELRRCAGAQFDPYLVEIFIDIFDGNNHT